MLKNRDFQVEFSEEHEVPQITQLTPITEDEEAQTFEIYYMKAMEHYSEVEAPANKHALEEEFVKVAEVHARDMSEVFRWMQGEYWSNPHIVGEDLHEKIQEFIRDSETNHTSMSSGDIVKLSDGDIQLCEPVGWSKHHLLKDGCYVSSESMADLQDAEEGY